MAMTLAAPNILRLIDFPVSAIEMVRESIAQVSSKPKITSEQNAMQRYMCFEFHLDGTPWNTESVTEGIFSRHLITTILQRFQAAGWGVVAALDLSRRLDDKVSFIFRSCAPLNVPYFCLAPGGSDTIRVINGDENVVQMVQNLINDYWPQGIYKESKH